MKRLTLALAGSAILALAAVVTHQSAAQAAPQSSAAMMTANDGAAPAPHGWRRGRGERLAAAMNNPAFQTLRNLRELERLYLVGGRAQEIPALYREVLQKTENPAVRQFAYRRIARNELRPADVDKSIATLRQSLDESLKRLPQQ